MGGISRNGDSVELPKAKAVGTIIASSVHTCDGLPIAVSGDTVQYMCGVWVLFPEFFCFIS